MAVSNVLVASGPLTTTPSANAVSVVNTRTRKGRPPARLALLARPTTVTPGPPLGTATLAVRVGTRLLRASTIAPGVGGGRSLSSPTVCAPAVLPALLARSPMPAVATGSWPLTSVTPAPVGATRQRLASGTATAASMASSPPPKARLPVLLVLSASMLGGTATPTAVTVPLVVWRPLLAVAGVRHAQLASSPVRVQVHALGALRAKR